MDPLKQAIKEIEEKVAELEAKYAREIREDAGNRHLSAEIVRHVALRRALIELFINKKGFKENGNRKQSSNKKDSSSNRSNDIDDESGGDGGLGF